MQIAFVAHSAKHADTLRRSLLPVGGTSFTILAPHTISSKRFSRVLIPETFLWSMQRVSTEGFALKRWFEDHVKTRLLPGGEIVNVG